MNAHEFSSQMTGHVSKLHLLSKDRTCVRLTLKQGSNDTAPSPFVGFLSVDGRAADL